MTTEEVKTKKPARNATHNVAGGTVVKKASKVVPKTAPKADVISKLRIRVRAYEYKILDLSVKQIIDTALRYDAKIEGPVPLPTETKKYTVNRASFVYKNAREQFEMRVHKRVIDILNPTPKIMEALTNMSLPSGVNIDVKIM
ncbi:MAG: 30S ribosomal protein S10 [Parcubacteria group bacterium GW2011_GWF2_40_69]|nr:MAG: 30S ribosomal protein S10 [Parcubacteria group bacterium GW2011_GWC1_39_12]KKR19389.1 MAG: 30S ribosomal protein S10 [Parcubacteria group bacterium GW2011_GWF1_39_37]KKR35229.1 MAG: 30S ribosomal protein S10 [Parcubacteria group bacterium GW2011_GWC2_40_10]KKR52338.1 MAG: 30S ribosomal protein S10 [Parcubacteria group bacterium GW2011_GWE1_40_20]KKR69382.1 MAG: 30S ribosomal protein S10 [Parcubacteria group bacterium GW2011_GWF2_40_69]KKR82010.1 MAG: 30S ribosomal protein S10 [Parcubac